MHETLHDSPINLMTAETKRRLEKELADFEQKAREASLGAGEAAGQGADWHDNPAYDQAVIDSQFYNTRAIAHREKLRNVEIIKPRTQTDAVGIGNEVVLRFSGEDENEVFTLLGESDADNDRGWVSISSPLGQNLLGKKKGESIEYKVGDQTQKVKIIEIKVGSFE